jgi:hypothetical protein
MVRGMTAMVVGSGALLGQFLQSGEKLFCRDACLA